MSNEARFIYIVEDWMTEQSDLMYAYVDTVESFIITKLKYGEHINLTPVQKKVESSYSIEKLFFDKDRACEKIAENFLEEMRRES